MAQKSITQTMEMDDDQQQQQRPHSIDSGIRDGIARLADRRYRNRRHILGVDGFYSSAGMDRRSLQHLVHFLDNDDSHEVTITELVLCHVSLLRPSDGGLEILRSFFARSDTTLTKVRLVNCDFGSAQEASQLLMAFQTNTTVTDLVIRHNANLRGVALGNCLSGVMQSMPQLQRLYCTGGLSVEGVRVFQPALKANRTLRELGLSCCYLGDDGMHLIADALVGNRIMEVLDMGRNEITSVGLADITRMIASTHIKTINFGGNRGIFNVEASTQGFAHVLSRHEFLRDVCISLCELGDNGIGIIADGLAGNTIMEVLNISNNGITSFGLAHITRLFASTQIKTIYLENYSGIFDVEGIFNDEDATQHFVTSLEHTKSCVQELPKIEKYHFPEGSRAAIYTRIENSLMRNRQLNRTDLLLAPPPPQQQQQQRNAGTMMLKLWHKAITKFAMVPNNAGASAIFKLFQARPQLLEKRIKRPASSSAAAAAAAAVVIDVSQN